MIVIYSMQNAGEGDRVDLPGGRSQPQLRFAWPAWGLAGGQGPPPSPERAWDSAFSEAVTGGRPPAALWPLLWERLGLLAEGCFSYDVILIAECKCLLIPPLTAWLICVEG